MTEAQFAQDFKKFVGIHSSSVNLFVGLYSITSSGVDAAAKDLYNDIMNTAAGSQIALAMGVLGYLNPPTRHPDVSEVSEQEQLRKITETLIKYNGRLNSQQQIAEKILEVLSNG